MFEEAYMSEKQSSIPPEATLAVEGKVIAFGRAARDEYSPRWVFWPNDPGAFSTVQSAPATLKLSHSGSEVLVTGFERCSASPLHWYLPPCE